MPEAKLTPDEVFSALKETLESDYVGPNDLYSGPVNPDEPETFVPIISAETSLDTDLQFDALYIGALIRDVFKRLQKLLFSRGIPFSSPKEAIPDGIRFLRKNEEGQLSKPESVGRLQEYLLDRLRKSGCLNETQAI